MAVPKDGSLSRRAFLRAGFGGIATSSLVLDVPAAEPGLHDLTSASALRLARAIRRKQVSSLEVVDAHLRRIDTINPALNAVVQISHDAARAAASAADRIRKRGDRVGPLHGVPITIKDSFDTTGIITTAGTSGHRTFVPMHDATVVARLRAAGAILLGKSNTPELTLSYETDNLVYGRTNNPYNLSRTSGGSSGGAAAVIAAGGSPLDVGSDTGGSIRVPSHFCGIVGLKPTSGRIPRTGHILSSEGVFQSFTQPGPMARRVEDLIMVLPILAGPDGRDPWIVPMPLRDPRAVRLRGLRVAVHEDNGIYTPSAFCIEAVQKAAKVLSAAGCVVTDFTPSQLVATYDLGNRLWRAAGPGLVRRLLEASGTTEASVPIQRLLSSSGAEGPEEWTVLEQLDRERSKMLAVFERCDALVCPPCAFPAIEHGATLREDLDSGFSYSEVYNYLGWPAGVVRCGVTPDSLPVGVQIVSSPWREDIVLALAQELETAAGGWRPPAI